jgi:hypothetical protein
MEHFDLTRFKNGLLQQRAELQKWLDSEAATDDIHLGGSSIQDVLQVICELDSALKQIDTGTFGCCTKCDGNVESDRLELDYTTRVCLSHYSEAQIEALERDLELAAKVQKQLLPCCVPSLANFEIAAQTFPARIVGGDYYDFYRSADNQQGIAVADVMGKGLPASMLMSNLQASLRILAPEYDNLHDLMDRLNTLNMTIFMILWTGSIRFSKTISG